MASFSNRRKGAFRLESLEGRDAPSSLGMIPHAGIVSAHREVRPPHPAPAVKHVHPVVTDPSQDTKSPLKDPSQDVKYHAKDATPDAKEPGKDHSGKDHSVDKHAAGALDPSSTGDS